MKAVIARGKGDYSYQDAERPQAPEGGLLMKVEACGVCAGDIKCYEGGGRFWGDEFNPPFCEPPFIPGHELVGRVCEVGAGYVGPFKAGDRITSEQLVPCGECRYCREGKYSLCDPHNVYGFKSFLNGGFAEYVALPKNARNFAIPEDMPMEKAVLVEPFACAMHAVDRARIGENDVVVIAGAGALGLAMISIAARLKPRALISIEPVAWLRERALALGASEALDAWSGKGVHPRIAELTEGCGCDVYIEATGHPAAISQGLNIIKKGGCYVEFSVFSGPATIDWSVIGDAKELDVYGVSLSPDCFERTIAGIADGSIKTDGVLTQVMPLSEYAEAFALAKARKAIKIALVP